MHGPAKRAWSLNVAPFQTCQSICTTAGDALFCFLLCLRSRLTRILSTFPEFQKVKFSSERHRVRNGLNKS